MNNIAKNFEEFIKGKTFSFTDKLNSADRNIIRYNEGLNKLSELTGLTKEELEAKRDWEYDKDNELIDLRWHFEKYAIEYTFCLSKENYKSENYNMLEDLNFNLGWWNVFLVED